MTLSDTKLLWKILQTKQTMSITKEIKTYYVKNERNGRVYKLIDTPGFGDTDGLKSDSNLIKMIEKKFKEEI